MISVYCTVPIALCVPDRPLSSDLVVESLKYLDIGATVLPPAVLEDASLNDETVEQLAKLDAIGVGGGSYIATQKGKETMY